MAIVGGWSAGLAPVPLNGLGIAALKLGVPANLNTGAASASIALPVDANSNPYKAYLISAVASAVWFNFNTAGDAAVANAANTYCVPPAAPMILIPPPGTAQVSAIQDTAAGHLTIVPIM